MPGKEHVAPGALKGKGERMLQKVYESARNKGYSKQRSAMQAWGAVRRAGFDPDHFDYEIEALEEIIEQLRLKDAYLDKQAKALGTEYHPAFIRRPRSRILSAARGGVRIGRTLGRPIKTTISRTMSRASRPTKITTTPKMPRQIPSYIADPSKLTKPIDLPGYDNLNNLRLVPYDNAKGYYPTRGLAEGQMVMPQNQFLKALEVIEQSE